MAAKIIKLAILGALIAALGGCALMTDRRWEQAASRWSTVLGRESVVYEFEVIDRAQVKAIKIPARTRRVKVKV